MQTRTAAGMALALLALGACGGTEEPASTEAQPGAGPDTLQLAPEDSIGVLMGDSNYVFGTIGEAVLTMEGDIAVLDETGACVKVYDRQGRFLRRIGRRGSGPGELLFPGGLAVLSDGSFAVMDSRTGGVHRFLADGTYHSLYTDFEGDGAPQWAWGVDSMAFVASYLDDEMSEGSIEMVSMVARWRDHREPEVVYWEHRFPYRPDDMGSFLDNALFSSAFAAGRDGRVYVAPISTSEYRINIYGPEGDSLGAITRDMPRVEKTPGEMEEEQRLITDILRERGVREEMNRYQPDPYRWLIQPQGLGVDGSGRLWVLSGAADGTVMDLYSPEGEHLGVVRLEGILGPHGGMGIVKVQADAILAWSLQAADYPKLYVYGLPEL